MNEYWEITHERAVATQSVWAMRPTFSINKLSMTQHGALTESLPELAQARSNSENELTDALTAKRLLFEKMRSLCVRVPSLIDGLLDDDDPLKDQLDAIFAIDAYASENSTLRRARLLLPLWTDVNAGRIVPPPPHPVVIDYQGTTLGVADLAAVIEDAQAAQQTASNKQRDVTNAKSALRADDLKLDRGNKRWYKAWLQAFPKGTPEGDAALSLIPTEGGTAQAVVLTILSATAQPNRTVVIELDPDGGAHATTKELQYKLDDEEEFGHSTPITADQITVGPFDPGATVQFRTRVANSNPGFVVSPVVTVVIPG